MKTWQMLRTLYRVSDFVSWQRAGDFDLSPSFQRRPVWKPGAKSFLIDTVARGLPMPIIFLREQRTNLKSLEPTREVVDGQQRIRTLFSYIDPSLLRDFDPAKDPFTVQANHNRELAGKSFEELPLETQHQILGYEFSVHVLPQNVDDREILQIFARMNATGVKLNSQELRNAEYFGEFKTSMYELALEQLPRWRNWRIFTEDSIARMLEVELTSEFALLMLRGVTQKTQSAIDKIYEQKDVEFPERADVEHRFRTVMDTIDDKLGSDIRYLAFRNRTLFYSLFAFVYDVQFGIESPLKKTKTITLSPRTVANIKVVGERIQSRAAPESVLESAARRTTHQSSRLNILKYIHDVAQDAQSST